MTRRKSTDYHEAGHAVIGRVLGLPCGQASIVEDYEDYSSGHAIIGETWEVMRVWEKRGKFRDIRSVHIARIMFYQAGAEADKEFGFVPKGDQYDRQQIYRSLTELDPSGSDGRKGRYEERLRSKTRCLVRRHHGSIERVAKALLEHKTLQDDQIYERINRAADD